MQVSGAPHTDGCISLRPKYGSGAVTAKAKARNMIMLRVSYSVIFVECTRSEPRRGILDREQQRQCLHFLEETWIAIRRRKSVIRGVARLDCRSMTANLAPSRRLDYGACALSSDRCSHPMSPLGTVCFVRGSGAGEGRKDKLLDIIHNSSTVRSTIPWTKSPWTP